MLKHYRNWTLLYEDDDQCFSKAEEIETGNDVLVITHFNTNRIKRTVKSLLPELLNHYLDAFEEESGYHIVLKYLKGFSLSTYLSRFTLDYQDRVKLCYEWIKSIVKYDQFPDALKIQLIDYEQLLIKDGVMYAREWIDYGSEETVDYLKMFKQMGETLEMLFPDAPLYQSQFIDTLKIGKHELISLAMFRKTFKDIFLYEKEDVFNKIPFEFDIVLNDRSAGPPIDVPQKPKAPKPKPKPIVPTQTFEQIAEDAHLEPLSEEKKTRSVRDEIPILSEPEDPTDIALTVAPQEVETPETVSEENIPAPETPDSEEVALEETVQIETVSDDLSKPEPSAAVEPAQPTESAATTMDSKAEEEVLEDEEEPIESVLESLTTTSEDATDGPQPTDRATRYALDDEEEIDEYAKEMDALFSEDDLPPEKNYRIKWKETALIALISLVIISAVVFVGWRVLRNDEPVAASFSIEKNLTDGSIPITNTSTGGKSIDTYLWEVYFDGYLVKTFNDKDLVLNLDSPGAYKIVLKLKDDKGNWSAPSEQTFNYIP